MSKQYVNQARVWRVNPAGCDGGRSPCPAVQRAGPRGAGPYRCARECLGGFRRRASLSEIRGGRVVAKDGTDVTGAFTCGAEEALRLALENGCTAAILKARSPCGWIRGNLMTAPLPGTRVPGEGVLSPRMAREAGLEIWSEETFTEGR